MFLDKVCSVARLQPLAGDANKENYQAVAGLEAVRLNLQPASPEFTAIAEGVFGKTFVGFTTTSGVSDGDRLTISGGKTYTVRGVEDWDFGVLPHYRLTLMLAEGA